MLVAYDKSVARIFLAFIDSNNFPTNDLLSFLQIGSKLASPIMTELR